MFRRLEEANEVYKKRVHERQSVKKIVTELEEMKAGKEEALTSWRESEATCEALRDECDELKQQIRKLEQENRNLSERFQSTKTALLQSRSMNRQLQDINNSFEDGMQILMGEQNIRLQKQLEDARAEGERLLEKNVQLVELVKGGNELKKAQEETIAELQSKLSQKIKEKRDIEEQLKLVVEDSREFEAQVNRLRTEIAIRQSHENARRKTYADTLNQDWKETAVFDQWRGGVDDVQNYLVELYDIMERVALDRFRATHPNMQEGDLVEPEALALTWAAIRELWLKMDPSIDVELDSILLICGCTLPTNEVTLASLFKGLRTIFRGKQEAKLAEANRRKSKTTRRKSTVDPSAIPSQPSPQPPSSAKSRRRPSVAFTVPPSVLPPAAQLSPVKPISGTLAVPNISFDG